jgi:hypothetical protein
MEMWTRFSSALGRDSVANSHEHSNELPGSVKDGKFHGYLKDCFLLKDECTIKYNARYTRGKGSTFHQ